MKLGSYRSKTEQAEQEKSNFGEKAPWKIDT